jgi:hypothetical protein
VKRLKLVELYDRGLKNFDSLSPEERDVFVVNDLDIYYEMEGGFEDYLLSGGHEKELSWLAGTLSRIGDAASGQVISRLEQMDEEQRPDMQLLCQRFYALKNTRWKLLAEYLAQVDIEIDELP